MPTGCLSREQSRWRVQLLMDLADAAGNASDGVHITSAPGAWKALPTQWRSLAFSLRFGDRHLRIELTHDEERYLESTKASRSP